MRLNIVINLLDDRRFYFIIRKFSLKSFTRNSECSYLFTELVMKKVLIVKVGNNIII